MKPDAPHKGSLLVVFLTVFIDLLGFGMVLPLLPIYAKQFGVDEHGIALGLLMASFSAMQFLFAPLWGRLSDRVGRRPVMMVGLAGSTAFYALFGVATARQSLFWLFVARIGAGIAGATISTAQAYIADSTTLETRAKGMALIGAAFGLGFTFGPLLCAAALVFSHDVAVSPMPGYTASALSCIALALAVFKLPESLRPGADSAVRGFFDSASLRDALTTPSIGMLLLTSFVSIVSFGSFETTISLLLKNEEGAFRYEPFEIVLFFAYIGLVLSLAQGLVVRRLAGRLTEPVMANAGAIVSILGFVLLVMASGAGSLSFLMLAAATDVIGFAFITPSLNSLISRRSNPEKQGGILGVTQSVGSLARIVCPMITMPLFAISPTLPYWAAVVLMFVGLGLLTLAARGGKDYAAPGTNSPGAS
jgi:MFS family permease